LKSESPPERELVTFQRFADESIAMLTSAEIDPFKVAAAPEKKKK